MDRADHNDLHELEQSWIAAETKADEAKVLAERAATAASELKLSAPEGKPDAKLLLGQADTYAVQRAQAEARAVEAFDRLWSARSGI